MVLFPVVALYGLKRRTSKETLLEKEDTQYMRGVAAWLVVMAHYTVNIKGVISTDIFGKTFSFVMGQLGGMGVLVFFFVSGYGIYASYDSKKLGWDFLWKRVKSVWLPYLAVNVTLHFMQFAIDGVYGFGPKSVLSILLAEDYWFVHVIMLQYLAFFIVEKWLDARKIVVYSFIIDAIFTVIFIYEGRTDGWFNALWLFTFGMACAKYQERIQVLFDKAFKITIIMCIVLFGVTGLIFAANKGKWWANPFKTGGGVFLCAGICGILRIITPSSKIMQYFGKRSLYLYIVHIGIWNLIKIADAMMHFWIATGVSVLITEVMYQIVTFLLNKCKRVIGGL